MAVPTCSRGDEGMSRAQEPPPPRRLPTKRRCPSWKKRTGGPFYKWSPPEREPAQANEQSQQQARSVIEGIRKTLREAAKIRGWPPIVAAASVRAASIQQGGARRRKLEETAAGAWTRNRQLYDSFSKRLSETLGTGRFSSKRSGRESSSTAVSTPCIARQAQTSRRIGSVARAADVCSESAWPSCSRPENTVQESRRCRGENLKRPLTRHRAADEEQPCMQPACSAKGEERAAETDPPFAEAIRTIRTAISLDISRQAAKDHPGHLLDSEVKAKSILRLKLRFAFGRAGKDICCSMERCRGTRSAGC